MNTMVEQEKSKVKLSNHLNDGNYCWVIMPVQMYVLQITFGVFDQS